LNLYLFRHGHAASPGGDTPSLLTQRGEKEVSQMALEMKRRGVIIEKIWHSPKDRAKQTAEILRTILMIPPTQVEEKEELTPDGDAQIIFQEVSKEKCSALLIVSHLPFLPELTDILLGDSSDEPLFPTAGAAALEGSGADWKLLWSIYPDLL
jgi:phosphohistidine phosphatase